MSPHDGVAPIAAYSAAEKFAAFWNRFWFEGNTATEEHFFVRSILSFVWMKERNKQQLEHET